MTVYVKVPEIVKGCDGCAAAGRYTGPESLVCKRLAASLADTPNRGCNGVIWIEDTKQARIDYITLKLERANGT